MHLTLFESVSLNGMIGRPDGAGDFFSQFCWTGFVEIARETGAMIWGRTTHDIVREWPAALGDLAGVTGVVLTRNEDYKTEPGWTVAATPRAAISFLESAGIARALVAGDQSVNTAFAREGLLDELHFFIESVAIGRGMPLFADQDFPDLKLALMDASRPAPSVLSVRYAVERQGESLYQSTETG